jgi:methionine-gamma-lyase
MEEHKAPGAMITIEDEDGIDAQKILINSAKLCALAVGLSNVETLIQHLASMTHFSTGKEARLAAAITDGFVPLSVGIEMVVILLSI